MFLLLGSVFVAAYGADAPSPGGATAAGGGADKLEGDDLSIATGATIPSVASVRDKVGDDSTVAANGPSADL